MSGRPLSIAIADCLLETPTQVFIFRFVCARNFYLIIANKCTSEKKPNVDALYDLIKESELRSIVNIVDVICTALSKFYNT